MKTGYDSEKPLLSLHLPKCGGTSFLQILKTWYGDKLYTHYFNEPRGEPPIQHKLEAGSCVHGHFNRARGFGIADYYPDIEQRITIFRNPFEIAVSDYFFTKRRIDKKMHYRDGEYRVRKMPDLGAYIASHSSHIFNFLPAAIDESSYQDVLDDYFIFVGVMERYNTTIHKLSALLRKPKTEIPHINQSQRSDEVPADIAKQFRERNRLAYLIYDYAVERLANS